MRFSETPYLRPVNYYETDKMAIVHHSNYIRWMEEARLDYMERAGLDYEEMERRGIIMPVTSVSCRYLRSAVYGDTVRIYVKPTLFNGVRAGFGYGIRIGDDDRDAAVGESSHCFLDTATRVPLNLKKRYPEFYERAIALMEGEA